LAALAALVRADAGFSFPPCAVGYDGPDASAGPATSTPRPAIPVRSRRRQLAAGVRRLPSGLGRAALPPLALAVRRVEEGRAVEVVHWDRPELFEAFGLPMSSPPSRRSSEHEVNAKEVR
jgi:hypothetical protein